MSPFGNDVAGADLLTLEAGRSPRACMFEGFVRDPCGVPEACNIRHSLSPDERVRSGSISSFAGAPW